MYIAYGFELDLNSRIEFYFIHVIANTYHNTYTLYNCHSLLHEDKWV